MSGVTTSQFQEVLNEHGYGFHYSVLGLVDELEKASKSNWRIDAVEFPVEVGKFTTKIDFILKRKHGNPFYILAECKRANPAFSRWFFARAPYSRLDYNFEHIDRTDVRSLLTYAIPMPVSSDEAPYHIALEVKTDKKGDRSGKSDGIEGAVTQLCVGLNGMVEFFARNLHIHGNETSVDFLPVLFTTAEI